MVSFYSDDIISKTSLAVQVRFQALRILFTNVFTFSFKVYSLIYRTVYASSDGHNNLFKAKTLDSRRFQVTTLIVFIQPLKSSVSRSCIPNNVRFINTITLIGFWAISIFQLIRRWNIFKPLDDVQLFGVVSLAWILF